VCSRSSRSPQQDRQGRQCNEGQGRCPPKKEPLVVNTASEAELKALPGVGAPLPRTVDGRPYKRKEELVQKKVVPQGTYDKIKDQVLAKQK
jgi:competence protein ComEA